MELEGLGKELETLGTELEGLGKELEGLGKELETLGMEFEVLDRASAKRSGSSLKAGDNSRCKNPASHRFDPQPDVVPTDLIKDTAL